MEIVKSGIYATFGTEKKDLITEATAQEFKDWMAIKGLNISFMSDGSLNGEFFEGHVPFLQWELRAAFIMDAEAKGISVDRNKDEWEAFLVTYREEILSRYG